MSNERPYRLAGNFEGSDPLEGVPEQHREAYADWFAEQDSYIQDSILYYQGEQYQREGAYQSRKLAKEEVELQQLLNRFKTAKQLFADGTPETKWLVPDFIPELALVTLQGRAKAGKSTLIFHMLKALLDGGEFLGTKLDPIKIVYLSEQPRSVFLNQLAEASIPQDSENLAALTVEENHGLGWDTCFKLATLKLKQMGAKLLVVDSWGRFAGFQAGEDEMSPAPTQRRITCLRALQAQTNATILILQHVSKDNSRGLIDSGMGSSALAQQVDLAVSLSGEPTKPEISSKKLLNGNCRAIQSVGRFPVRDRFAIELKDGQFVNSQFKADVGETEGTEEWLRSYLAGGAKDSDDIKQASETAGFSKNALWDAKDSLGILAKKVGKKWQWVLPVETSGFASFSPPDKGA